MSDILRQVHFTIKNQRYYMNASSIIEYDKNSNKIEESPVEVLNLLISYDDAPLITPAMLDEPELFHLRRLLTVFNTLYYTINNFTKEEFIKYLESLKKISDFEVLSFYQKGALLWEKKLSNKKKGTNKEQSSKD